MKIKISDEILKDFPEVNIGVLLMHGIKNKKETSESTALRKESEKIANEKLKIETITEHLHIVAWRETFRKFGAKPSDYRSSAEALLRRVLKGNPLPAINAVVDIYNSVSIQTVLPLGGYDLSKVKDFIEVRYSKPNEHFLPIGATQKETLEKREAVYADAEKVLCSKWNYRDCEQAKITEHTTNAVLFIDGCPGIPKNQVEEALNLLKQDIHKVCGGELRTYILNAKNKEIDI
jgi:lysyl-tRNA synthetase class 2